MKKQELNYSIYTPKDIAVNMIDKVLARYFSTGDRREKLENIKICDISCGNGNLLIPAVKKLLKISKEVYGEYRFLSTWISGYDINEAAINLAKRNIALILEKHGINCKINLKVCDSLKITGEKYNILIGNPPYLGEKNNKKIFQDIKNTDFGKRYYEARMDYFYFFIEKGVDLLEEDGYLIYLTTYYWLRADSGRILRDTLRSNGNFLNIEIYDSSLFINADGQHNIIFLWEKSLKSDKMVKVELPNKKLEISNIRLYDKENKIILADENEFDLNNLILEKSNYFLQDLVNVNQGIISGHDKAFIFKEYDEKFAKYLKPFYKNKDIQLYSNDKNKYWILYLDKGSKLTAELEEYLLPFKEKLQNRREVKAGQIKWWQLQWGREEYIFNSPKILVRQRCKTNQFSYDDTSFYGSADIYFITKKSEEISLFYILGYMNSTMFLKWFSLNGKFKGINYEFYATPLKHTPIYYPSDKEKIKYVEELVKKQILNYSDETQKEIDAFFTNIYKSEVS